MQWAIGNLQKEKGDKEQAPHLPLMLYVLLPYLKFNFIR